jgi:hypothetical protein
MTGNTSPFSSKSVMIWRRIVPEILLCKESRRESVDQYEPGRKVRSIDMVLLHIGFVEHRPPIDHEGRRFSCFCESPASCESKSATCPVTDGHNMLKTEKPVSALPKRVLGSRTCTTALAEFVWRPQAGIKSAQGYNAGLGFWFQEVLSFRK